MKYFASLFLIAGTVGVVLPHSAWGANKRSKAGTIELGLYTGGTFDLPGAAGYAGICQVRFPDDCRQKFQAGRKSPASYRH